MCVRACVECWSVRWCSCACVLESSSVCLTDADTFMAIVCTCNTQVRTCRAIACGHKEPRRVHTRKRVSHFRSDHKFQMDSEATSHSKRGGSNALGNPSRPGCMPSCQLPETRHDHSRDGRETQEPQSLFHSPFLLHTNLDPQVSRVRIAIWMNVVCDWVLVCE